MSPLIGPPLITDAQFNSVALVCVALITIIPTTLAAFWARSAKNSSAETAREVMTNGGMESPLPNVNDHIKYQTEMLETLVERQDNTEQLLANHISHSRMMDVALAEVYMTVKPTVKLHYDTDDQFTTEKPQ